MIHHKIIHQLMILKDLQPENPPSFVDKCTQTDLTCEDIKYMGEAKTKLEDKQELKREIFMDDVLKATSLCIFTLDCLHMQAF